MSSDSRWTGGLANREWQSGTRVEPMTDTDYINWQVKRYLADCAQFSLTPSKEDALKVIFWTGDAQKQAVISAYQQQAGRRDGHGQSPG